MAASLWTRRRMSLRGALVTPSSPPIALTIQNSNTACPLLSIQSASSPSVSPRTPSIFASMLLDEPPCFAARRTEAAAVCKAWSDSASVDDTTLASLTSHPAWLVASDDALDSKIPQFSIAQSRADLRIEIDMATLATEMALSTLDSDSEESTDSSAYDFGDRVPAWKGSRRPRLRLLPDFARIVGGDVDDIATAQRLARDRNSERIPSLSSATTQTDGSSYGSLSPCTPFDQSISEQGCVVDGGELTGSRSSFAAMESIDIDGNEEDKPIRKGRARMSQEKRRRLARRREREAMLLGLPPRSASAPAHQTSFAGYQATQQDCGRGPMQVGMASGDSMQSGLSYARAVSTPQLSVVDCSHVEAAPPLPPPPRSVTYDHLRPPTETSAGMVRSASTPNALQFSGNNQWRGSSRDSKLRPLLQHHHQHQSHSTTRPVLVSGAKPTIVARSPVFGSWPSRSDAQTASSWRSRASDGSVRSP